MEVIFLTIEPGGNSTFILPDGFVTYTNVDSIQFYGLAFDVVLY